MEEAAPKTRRAQVANACMKCRDAKLKCSSTRPVCDRCHDRKLACVYDVTEGMTKRQQDRVDLLDSGEQLHRRRMLLQFLQGASIEEAVEMLARLRSGYSLDSEYLRVRDQFRIQDGVFVLLGEEEQKQQQKDQQQEQQVQPSNRTTTTTTTTTKILPDAPTQKAIQREYLELIKWNDMPIDPQLLQQQKDQQQQRQQERHEQAEQPQQRE